MYNLIFKKQTSINDWFITSTLEENNGLIFVSMINPLGDNDKSKLMTKDELFNAFKVYYKGNEVKEFNV